jgi:hypothetical protein
VNSKSYAVAFTKKSPSVCCEWECFKIRNIAEGDKDEKEFITYGMGVQVSCGMGTEETAGNSIWKREKGRLLKIK